MRIPRAVAPLLLLALGLHAVVVVATANPASALPSPIVVDEWADEVNADGAGSRREAGATLDAGAQVVGRIVPTNAITPPGGTLTVGLGHILREEKMRRILTALA